MKLSARWSLWMLGFAALLVLLDLAALRWAIRAETSRQEDAWRAAHLSELSQQLAARASAAARALEALTADADFRAWCGQPESTREWLDAAPRFATRGGLDQLLLLDSEGRIVVSAVHPESYGLAHPAGDFLQRALPAAPILYAEWEGSEHPIHVGASRRIGDTLLIGALRLDREELQSMAQRLRLRELRWQERSGLETPSDFQPQRPWRLLARVEPSPAAAALQSLSRRVLPLQLGLIGLAALFGLWWGRRVARPIEALSRGVDALRRRSAPAQEVPRRLDEVQRLRRNFAAMAEELEAAEVQRAAAERRGAWREIAQRIAHEIKNVLSPLSLALDNLETVAGRQDESARAIAARSLQTAREQLHSLDRLVAEFRSFARIPPPTLRELDVRALCHAARDALRESFPGHPLTLLESPTLHGVRGDEEQLRRALVNLLRNAAEAAPGQPIELAYGDGPGPAHWWCSVRDRGPGLPPEILAQLGQPVHSRKSGGSGLGLSIVVQTLRAHGGRLLARPAQGGGSELRWELPREPQDISEDGVAS